MLACRKQLFTKGKKWKKCESYIVSSEDQSSKYESPCKENKSGENLSTNIKILSSKDSYKHHETQNYGKTPEMLKSGRISIDSDFKSLKENSIPPKTPVSEKWRHFLQSNHRTKFLNSNRLSTQKTKLM